MTLELKRKLYYVIKQYLGTFNIIYIKVFKMFINKLQYFRGRHGRMVNLFSVY